MKTIEEKNIMLAQFMGFEFEDGQERIFMQGLGSKLIDETFNESWDWLYPVLLKIKEIENVTDILINILTGYTTIEYDSEEVNTTFCSNSSVATYDVVVQFIEWYNQNQK